MIIKYAGFLFTLLWSYTFIKSQSIFKKGSGILITLFVTNISWFTFIAACFYGLKNFSFYHALLGIALSIVLVHLAFSRLTLFINNKFQDKNTLLKIKTFIEYLILIAVGYFVFNYNLYENIRGIQVIAWSNLFFGLLLYFSDKFIGIFGFPYFSSLS